MSPVAALLRDLQARGVALRPDGPRLRVRPIEIVRADELETLRQHKAEVFKLLKPELPAEQDWPHLVWPHGQGGGLVDGCAWFGRRDDIAGHQCPSPAPPSASRVPDLDLAVVCESFGIAAGAEPAKALATAMSSGRLNPRDVTQLHAEVVAAVAQLEWEIASGRVERRLRLVRGRPLADWLSLDDVARLLRAGGR